VSLLTAEQFKATMEPRPVRVDPEEAPPFDFWPYFDAIPPADFAGFDFTEEVVTSGRRRRVGASTSRSMAVHLAAPIASAVAANLVTRPDATTALARTACASSTCQRMRASANSPARSASVASNQVEIATGLRPPERVDLDAM
jgi:hypothetical protein